MSALNPTPADLLCDAQGRPYFLWDSDMTLSEFRALLAKDDEVVRAHAVAKLMRQAKPDDVFSFVSLADVRRLWSLVEPQLGNKREFWRWVMDAWQVHSDAA